MSLSFMNRHPASVVGLLYPPLTVQNGVVDNKVFMADTGAPSVAPRTVSGAKSINLGTEHELDGCFDELDNAKVNSPRVPLPVRKGIGYDSGFHSSDDDGSLPTSPDSQPCCPEFPTAVTELHRETRELIGAFYRKHTGLSRSELCRHKEMEAMRKVVNKLLLKHEIVFKGMLKKLDMDNKDDGMSFVKDVAESTFNDGITNWGRIATLVAFGAVLSAHLKEAGRPECVEAVADQISSYLAIQKYDWLVNNNRWRGFVDFFHVEDPESAVRSTLMAVAGFASLGAGLAYLIR